MLKTRRPIVVFEEHTRAGTGYRFRLAGPDQLPTDSRIIIDADRGFWHIGTGIDSEHRSFGELRNPNDPAPDALCKDQSLNFCEQVITVLDLDDESMLRHFALWARDMFVQNVETEFGLENLVQTVPARRKTRHQRVA